MPISRLLRYSSRAAGVEVGSAAVIAVEVDGRNPIKVKNFVYEIISPDASIKSAFAKTPIASLPVRTVLPSESVAIDRIEGADVPRQGLDEALMALAIERLPHAEGRVIYSSHPAKTPLTDDPLETAITAFATPEDATHNTVESLAYLGLHIDVLTARPLALLSGLKLDTAYASYNNQAVVDIQPDAVHLAFYHRDNLLFYRELRAPQDVQLPNMESKGSPRFLSWLAEEVQRSVVFCKQKFRVDNERIVLAGQHSDFRSIVGPLSEALRSRVDLYFPAPSLDLSALGHNAEQFERYFPTFCVALGLAVYDSAHVEVNLLPGQYVAQPAYRKIAAVAAIVLAVLGLVGGLMRYRTDGEITKKKQELSQVQAQANASRDALQLASDSGQRRTRALGEMLVLNDLPKSGPALAHVLSTIANTAPPSVRFDEIQSELEDEAWTIIVVGDVRQPDGEQAKATFQDFIAELKKVTVFKEVELERPLDLSLSATRLGGEPNVNARFAVRIVIGPGA